MSPTSTVSGWLASHRHWCMPLLRMYLGIGLVVKGLSFAFAPDALASQIAAQGMPVRAVMLAHYVILAHVAGGAMLAIGAATRVAVLLQLPVLFGAVFLVHWGGGILGTREELQFSALVLVLLVAFLWHGSGALSVDSLVARRRGEAAGGPA